MGDRYYNRSYSYTYNIEAKKRHIFGKLIDKEYAVKFAYQMEQVGKQEGDMRYLVVSDIKKIAAIKNKNAMTVVAADIADDVTAQYAQYSNVIESPTSDYMNFAAIPGNVKADQVTLSIEKSTEYSKDFTNLTEKGGQWYAVSNSHAEYNLCSITCDLTTNKYTQANSYVGKITSHDIPNTPIYHFVVTHKNKKIS